MANTIPIEKHPLAPFLPEGARILMLGSFPPKHERWSMEFFYPNWINDMWRIFGLIFFDFVLTLIHAVKKIVDLRFSSIWMRIPAIPKPLPTITL